MRCIGLASLRFLILARSGPWTTDLSSVTKQCTVSDLPYQSYVWAPGISLLAAANGIGDLNFNKIAATHSEFWFRKFNDRFNAVQGKTGEHTHKWIN